MELDLGKIIGAMGPFALAVAGALALMAVASLAVFFERLWVMTRSRKLSEAFAPIAQRLIEADELPELAKAAERQTGNQLANLLGAGARAFVSAQQKRGKVAPVELARRELDRKSDVVAAELRRGMSVLATVGSVSPFVGLLGTVVGIIAAFEGIAKAGSGGIGAVSGGIAEALVVTAFGLLVAIPAVLAYNHLTTRSDKLLLAIDQAKGEFLDHLEFTHGDEVAAAHGQAAVVASDKSARDAA